MEKKRNKSLNYYMRTLHRDVGFMVVGFTLIFSISGIILIFRETDFLKTEQIVEKTLSPNMESSDVGKALHIRDLKVLKEEGVITSYSIHYTKLYDPETGIGLGSSPSIHCTSDAGAQRDR